MKKFKMVSPSDLKKKEEELMLSDEYGKTLESLGIYLSKLGQYHDSVTGKKMSDNFVCTLVRRSNPLFINRGTWIKRYQKIWREVIVPALNDESQKDKIEKILGIDLSNFWKYQEMQEYEEGNYEKYL